MDISLMKNMDKVREFMVKPEIWERLADDMADKKSWFPISDNDTAWLAWSNGDDIKAIIILETITSVCIGIHPYMLKNARKYVHEMMKQFFRWFLDNTETKVNKISVYIPFCYKTVHNCAKNTGFIDEGVDRGSYMKDGTIYDRWLLGITRKEIEGII